MGNWLQKTATALRLTGSAKPEEPPAAPKHRGEVAVLAVDDDAEFLATIRPLLLSYGFEVYTAGSGPKGLTILAYAPENLKVLLLDYQMPGFDGAKTMQYVRQVRPKIKVIAVTGIQYDQLAPEFRESVDKIIFKPFKAADLVAAIEEAINPHAQPAVTAAASARP
ncbi:MAG: response regulator [Verrucomicrobia bacterium]|nr:response regulator [Verrucomicrobiota bacterium]